VVWQERNQGNKEGNNSTGNAIENTVSALGKLPNEDR